MAESSSVTGWPAEMADLRALLDTVFERTGFDFREYAFSSLRRRVSRAAQEAGAASVAELHRRVREDDRQLGRLVRLLTVHTTAMFRDPEFFLLLREKVAPVLATYPFVRVWVAGCSTGEELYSISILLHEEGLAGRCRIYATDVSDRVLAQARSGIFPLSVMQDYSRNYQQAGGKAPFSEYYTADSASAVFRKHLRERVVFGTHNLVSDASFNEFHLILCRNVLIYFQRDLQDRVQRLFYQSLILFGFLGLGRSETIRFSSVAEAYETLGARERLLRKIR